MIDIDSDVHYVMNIGRSQSMVSIVTMASSITIVSGSEDTFCEAISFSLSRLGLSGVCLKEEQLAHV